MVTRPAICRIIGGSRCGPALPALRSAKKIQRQTPCPAVAIAEHVSAKSFSTRLFTTVSRVQQQGHASVQSGQADHDVKGKAPEESRRLTPLQLQAQKWENVGLNTNLSRQLVTALPHLTSPTAAQNAVMKAMQKPCDIILRAHTGTGKSFGILLALLNMPRITYIPPDGNQRRGISSIVIVPSRELAWQYEHWAKQIFPASMHEHLSKIISVRTRSKDVSVEEHMMQIRQNSPHILILVSTLAQEIFQQPLSGTALGLSNVRTLVLDEVDALLDLPGRFPSQKQIWRHQKHLPAGLAALNEVMKRRATCSGGEAIVSSGLERSRGETTLSEAVRRNAHRGSQVTRERSARGKSRSDLAPPFPHLSGDQPIRLVVASATASSVLRHFLGARTGWLRTGVRNERGDEVGKFIDVTGLSQGIGKSDEIKKYVERSASWPVQLPRELQHSCIVVDESVEGEGAPTTWRNLDPSSAANAKDTDAETDIGARRARQQDHPQSRTKPSKSTNNWSSHVVASTKSMDDLVDHSLLTALAYIFALQSVQRGVAFIPPSWSVAKTRRYLEDLGVPVQDLSESERKGWPQAEEVLYLMPSTAGRGLDIPGGVSHVFNVGIDAVRDTTLYTHLAGRAARIGQHVHQEHVPAAKNKEGNEKADVDNASAKFSRGSAKSEELQRAPERARGQVVTIIRGLSTREVRHNRRRKRLLRESKQRIESSQGGATSEATFTKEAEANKQSVSRSESLADEGLDENEAAAIANDAQIPALPPPTETPNSSAPILATHRIVSSGEIKMALIYRRLSLAVQKMDNLRTPIAEAAGEGEGEDSSAEVVPPTVPESSASHGEQASLSA